MSRRNALRMGANQQKGTAGACRSPAPRVREMLGAERESSEGTADLSRCGLGRQAKEWKCGDGLGARGSHATAGVAAGTHDFDFLCDTFAVGAAVFGVGGWDAATSGIPAFLGCSHHCPPWLWSQSHASCRFRRMDSGEAQRPGDAVVQDTSPLRDSNTGNDCVTGLDHRSMRTVAQTIACLGRFGEALPAESGKQEEEKRQQNADHE